MILIVTSLVGGFGRWETIAAAVMFGQFILQSVLVLQRESTPPMAALHPVNGFLILLIAVWLARDAWRRLPRGRRRARGGRLRSPRRLSPRSVPGT